MSSTSRTGRSVLNAGASVGTQVILIGLSFVTRTVFIAQIGTDLLGVQTLLLSVLAVLAVADLGLTGALTHALYKPLHDADHAKVSAIVRHAARLYRLVALVVAVLGLCLTPFLKHLVDLDQTLPLLQLYFLVMLADVVAAFLMVHRTILLTADQRLYLVKAYAVAFAIARTVCQVVALVLFESFLTFLVIQVAFTIATNALTYWRAGRLYPYLSAAVRLGPEDRASIRESVKAMLVYRFGGVVLNSSDPILISVLISTVTLGYFANYMLLVGSAVMLLEAAFSAFWPGVGHLVASADVERSKRVLNEMSLLAHTVYGWAALIVVVGLDGFIQAWIGAEFVLGPWVVAALALNLYVVGTMAPIWAFRGATGMFRETQYVFLATAVLNLLLSVVLAQYWGVAGVLVATAIARLSTGAWFEPWVLLRRHLGGSFRNFAGSYLANFSIWTVLCAAAFWTQASADGAAELIASGMLVLLAAPAAVWVLHRRSNEWADLSTRAQTVVTARRR
jgi:O-antigen/teichoic acid export membrane protein